jgi:hypothetical protein
MYVFVLGAPEAPTFLRVTIIAPLVAPVGFLAGGGFFDRLLDPILGRTVSPITSRFAGAFGFVSTCAMGWGSLAFLANASASDFHAFIDPLANMTTLTYTSTAGCTYFKPADANATVAGWERSALRHDPATGGMRALVFVQNATGRGVIAFRGTDLNDTNVSGQADHCADSLLWTGSGGGALPAYCKQWDARTLDYLGRALDFSATVRGAYPGMQFLHTGHSLGAGLGIIVAAAAPAPLPALVFSAPGLRDVLANRTGVDPASVAASHELVILADEWDPVYQGAIRGAGLVGQACVWRTVEDALCELCYTAPGAVNMTNPACEGCFAKHHIYAHYLDDLVANKTWKPACAPTDNN